MMDKPRLTYSTTMYKSKKVEPRTQLNTREAEVHEASVMSVVGSTSGSTSAFSGPRVSVTLSSFTAGR